ncbi:hypothetical protein B0H19DRAFT_1084250 [Mycena capillaripes]|nr:hypothetical protein B0H19DRAFT_1084250 [Mycena capillaripes]
MAGPFFRPLLALICALARGGPQYVCKSKQKANPKFPDIIIRDPNARDLCAEDGAFLHYQYERDGDTTVTVQESTKTRRLPDPGTNHLVEVNIVKAVFESGGVCDRIDGMYKAGMGTQAEAAYTAVLGILNSHANLVFADAPMEDQKTLVAAYAKNPKENLNFAQGKDTTVTDLTAKRLQAANDYLSKTKTRSVAVAQALDKAILSNFPNIKVTLKVETEWNKVLSAGISLAAKYAHQAQPATAPVSPPVAGAKAPVPPAKAPA